MRTRRGEIDPADPKSGLKAGVKACLKAGVKAELKAEIKQTVKKSDFDSHKTEMALTLSALENRIIIKSGAMLVVAVSVLAVIIKL